MTSKRLCYSLVSLASSLIATDVTLDRSGLNAPPLSSESRLESTNSVKVIPSRPATSSLLPTENRG